MNQQAMNQAFNKCQAKPNTPRMLVSQSADGSVHTAFVAVWNQPKNYKFNTDVKGVHPQFKEHCDAGLQRAHEMLNDLAKNPPQI